MLQSSETPYRSRQRTRYTPGYPGRKSHRTATGKIRLFCLMGAMAGAALLCGAPKFAMAGGALEIPFSLANFNGNPLVIDNPYWPLNPDGTTGRTFTYVAETEDGCEVEQATIVGSKTLTGGAAPYNGFQTLEVEDIGYVDPNCTGNPGDWIKTEHTFDRYRQDDYGNNWYLGELSLDYEADSGTDAYDCSDTSISPSTADQLTRPNCYIGSWEAGKGHDGGPTAEAGIVVPSDDPMGTGELIAPGTYFMQEFDEDAMDVAKIIKVDAKVKYKIDGEMVVFQGCRVTKEYSALEPGTVEQKSYCPDDDGLVVIEELMGGKTKLVVLDSVIPALP